MAKLDYSVKTTIPLVERDTEVLVERLKMQLNSIEGTLADVRAIVREHGRAAIAKELGSDAAAILTVYARLKEAVEAAKQIEVDDLP